MATQTQIEKLSGSAEALSLPVFVYDDGGADLDAATAKAAALAAAPDSVLSVPQDGNEGIQRISSSAWQITVNYRIRKLRRLPTLPASPTPTSRIRFNFQAEGRRVEWAPVLGRFAPPGAGTLEHGEVILPGDESNWEIGVDVQPPFPNLGRTISLPTATISPAWARNLSLAVGCTNSVAFGAYAIGELFLCSVHGGQVDSDRFELDFSWSYKPNVTGETRGDVTGIEYRGHDLVWMVNKRVVDVGNNAIGSTPKFVYVNQVWPEADLRASALGVEAP